MASLKNTCITLLPPLPVLVLPKGTNEETLRDARSAGYLPVMADDPSMVAVVLPASRMVGDDLLMSALFGMAGNESSSERSRMVQELHRRLLSLESK